MPRFRPSRLSLFLVLVVTTRLCPATEEAVRVADMEPVVVTATRLRTSLEDIPAAVSVVDREAIQLATQQLSLDESLRSVPGVFVLNPYNFAQDTRIAIRGFGARSDFGIRGIRLVVDGIPATLPDGQAGVDGIDFGSAERVEVIRGPASALYGAASGGVIRIESEQGPPRPFLETRLSGGEDGFFKAQFKAGGDEGAYNYLVSGSRLLYDGYRANSRTENVKFNAKLQYRFDSGAELTTVVNLIDIPVQDDPGGLTAAEVREDPSQARDRNLQFDAGERVAQQKLGFAYRRPVAVDHELRANAYLVHRDFANKLPFSDGGQVTFDRIFYGGGATYVFNGERFRVLAGFDAGHQDDARKNYDNLAGERGPLALDQDERVTSAGVFLIPELTLTERLTLSGALRHDRVAFDVDDRFTADGDDSGELVFRETSPMLGLRWELRPGLNLYGNVATSFETPTTTEFDNPTGGGFNEDLQPQTAFSYEAGLRSRIDRAPWPLTVDLAVFAIDVEDALVPFERADSPGREFYRNAGSTRKRGIELALTAEPTPRLTATASYTYSDFQYERFDAPDGDFSGNTLPGVPEHFGNLRLAYRDPGGFFASWNTRLVGPLYADDANTTEVDGYSVSDLRVGLERELGSWTVAGFLGLNNVFDADYPANVRINAFGGRYYEPAPERNLYAGLRLRYSL